MLNEFRCQTRLSFHLLCEVNGLLNKILCSCITLFLVLSGAPGGTTVSGAAQEEPKETFDQRLGPDDGAALAILFIANMRGNLGLCDCNHPRGGLARRVGYVEGFRKKFPDTPILQVEAGSFWYTPSDDRVVTLQTNSTEAFIGAARRGPWASTRFISELFGLMASPNERQD